MGWDLFVSGRTQESGSRTPNYPTQLGDYWLCTRISENAWNRVMKDDMDETESGSIRIESTWTHKINPVGFKRTLSFRRALSLPHSSFLHHVFVERERRRISFLPLSALSSSSSLSHLFSLHNLATPVSLPPPRYPLSLTSLFLSTLPISCSISSTSL